MLRRVARGTGPVRRARAAVRGWSAARGEPHSADTRCLPTQDGRTARRRRRRGRREGPPRRHGRLLHPGRATVSMWCSPTATPAVTTCWSARTGCAPPRVRRQLGIEAEPSRSAWASGGCTPAGPPRSTTPSSVYDGPCYIAGFTPTGPDTLYAYLVEPAQDRSAHTPERKSPTMRELATPYHGPWDEIREDITDADRINYTWFEHLLIDGRVEPRPGRRHRRRRAHLPTHPRPRARRWRMEDASVLAELLLTRDRVDQDLFDAFVARRMPRASAVVTDRCNSRPGCSRASATPTSPA